MESGKQLALQECSTDKAANQNGNTRLQALRAKKAAYWRRRATEAWKMRSIIFGAPPVDVVLPLYALAEAFAIQSA
jgi:hypothetical protein